MRRKPPAGRDVGCRPLGSLLLDADKVREMLIARNLSAEEFADKAHVGLRTIRSALTRRRVHLSSAWDIAGFLKVNIIEIMDEADLHPWKRHAGSKAVVHEWEIDGDTRQRMFASNGLIYEVFRLRHEHVPERLARGKRYDVSRLATADRKEKVNYLKRHAVVCGHFRGHPQIPINVAPLIEEGEDCWWVIDEWIPGHALDEVLKLGPVDQDKLPRLMWEIAQGLEALHGEGIIRRELSPRFVILRDGSERVVLTDFELAKLLDGSPTVAGRWPDDEYRAPEAGEEGIDARADLYSWGRILVRAIAGGQDPIESDNQVLAAARLPKRVREVGLACVAKPCSERPRSIQEVIQALGKWGL